MTSFVNLVRQQLVERLSGQTTIGRTPIGQTLDRSTYGAQTKAGLPRASFGLIGLTYRGSPIGAPTFARKAN
jgi:hypothetical protein